MEEILNRLQHNLDTNTPCEASDIQAVVGFAREWQWVSVGNELPEPQSRVMAFASNGRVFQALYDGEAFACYTINSQEFYVGSVTHWQPLPNPPENE